MYETSEGLDKDRWLRLPAAPMNEAVPAPQQPEARDVLDVGARLAVLHFMALQTAYGLAPSGVSVRVALELIGDTIHPAVVARTSGDGSPEAEDWLSAFEAGLDHWSEAGFADPLVKVMKSNGPGGRLYAWGIQTYRLAQTEAAVRLKRSDRHEMYNRRRLLIEQRQAEQLYDFGFLKPKPSIRRKTPLRPAGR